MARGKVFAGKGVMTKKGSQANVYLLIHFSFLAVCKWIHAQAHTNLGPVRVDPLLCERYDMCSNNTVNM